MKGTISVTGGVETEFSMVTFEHGDKFRYAQVSLLSKQAVEIIHELVKVFLVRIERCIFSKPTSTSSTMCSVC